LRSGAQKEKRTNKHGKGAKDQYALCVSFVIERQNFIWKFAFELGLGVNLS
jgi:hypothetical protein